MSRIILFNKPFGVLSQFTLPKSDTAPAETLAEYIDIPGVYAAGRLDKDSEGLVVLTDDGNLQKRISHPKHKMPKTYWVQVEGAPGDAEINRLQRGVNLKDGTTAPAKVQPLSAPEGLWARTSPVRYRKTVPDFWLEITLTEGRNRQVRRMTAAVGCPTLRLIRVHIGPWRLGELKSGDWRQV